MPSPAFHLSLPFILRWEGGFVDDPDDPGGRTNKGVTHQTYNDWRARQGLGPKDVKLITDDEVAAIYERDYWLGPRCDVLRRPLDLAQFDTAVNMGIRRSVRILQSALGCGVDGAFGQATARAAAECDIGATVAEYCRIREGVYRNLAERNPKLAKFLKGWLNRLNALRKEAGLPGLESVPVLADTGPIARIADLPDGAALETWK
jgi:lysozyme family protein